MSYWSLREITHLFSRGIRCMGSGTLELIFTALLSNIAGQTQGHVAKWYAWYCHTICMCLYFKRKSYCKKWMVLGTEIPIHQSSLIGNMLQNKWAYCSSFQGQCECAMLAGSVGTHALQYYVVVMRYSCQCWQMRAKRIQPYYPHSELSLARQSYTAWAAI